MVKKDFRAGLGASIKAQDVASRERFETADVVISGLPGAAGKQQPAAQASRTKTLVVRHTFSMSDGDYVLLDALRKAAAVKGALFSASDICRIGLHAIRGYSGDEVVSAVNKLERLRQGRRV